MARTGVLTLAAVLDGVSVARVSIPGAREHRAVDAHISSDECDLDAKHFTNRTVAPDHAVAAGLWASVAESVRAYVRELEPELAGELDAAADIRARPGTDLAAGRATAASAERARRDRAATDAARDGDTDE